MQCPACSNQLQQLKVSDVTVDICKNGCGGIWFDNFEMKKFDEPHEETGEELLNVAKDPNIKINPSKRFKCPKCDDVVMMRHFFSVKKKVTLDECPGCGGIWLDAGELAQIRTLFNTEQERHQASEEYFKEVFGDKLKTMKQQDEAKLGKTKSFANMFRFICPTNYIPGKQSWGAF